MALIGGVDRTSTLAVNMTASGTIILEHGIPVTAAGELRTTVTTGAPAAGSIVKNGLCYAADGSIRVTTDAIGIVDKGVAYTALRVLCHTTDAPANTSKMAFVPGIGMVLVDTTGRVHVA